MKLYFWRKKKNYFYWESPQNTGIIKINTDDLESIAKHMFDTDNLDTLSNDQFEECILEYTLKYPKE